MLGKLACLSALVAGGLAQQVGKETAETHPKITWQKCTRPGSCTTVNGEVTIDANWRWTHDTKGLTNCYDGNKWNETICKDAKSCASNCAIEGMFRRPEEDGKGISVDILLGADYKATYGASTSGNALTIQFVTKGQYCKLSFVGFNDTQLTFIYLSDQRRVSVLSHGQRHQISNVHSSR